MSKDRPQLAAPSQIVLVRLFLFFFFTHVSARCEDETPHSIYQRTKDYVQQPNVDFQITVLSLHCFAKSVRLILCLQLSQHINSPLRVNTFPQ